MSRDAAPRLPAGSAAPTLRLASGPLRTGVSDRWPQPAVDRSRDLDRDRSTGLEPPAADHPGDHRRGGGTLRDQPHEGGMAGEAGLDPPGGGPRAPPPPP